MKQIEINDLSFGFNSELILKNINFAEEAGEIVAIHGENGTGKSTLLKLILGELTATSGEIKVQGQNLRKMKDFSRIAYVPQLQTFDNITFPITCTEIVALNLYRQFGFFKIPRACHREAARKILTEMGLQDYLDTPYNQLSGGFKQRTLIARAMINNPELLILDEPTAGVDQASKVNFLQLIKETNQKKKTTVLIVTHEMTLVEQQLPLDAVYEMKNGGLQKC